MVRRNIIPVGRNTYRQTPYLPVSEMRPTYWIPTVGEDYTSLRAVLSRAYRIQKRQVGGGEYFPGDRIEINVSYPIICDRQWRDNSIKGLGYVILRNGNVYHDLDGMLRQINSDGTYKKRK